MLLAKSKIICPGFGPFQASFSIFLKLNQFHNFRKGASIFAPRAPFSSNQGRRGGKWGYPSVVEGITFFPSLGKELFSKLVQLSSKCRKKSVYYCC